MKISTQGCLELGKYERDDVDVMRHSAPVPLLTLRQASEILEYDHNRNRISMAISPQSIVLNPYREPTPKRAL
jgi:hypothetical protein